MCGEMPVKRRPHIRRSIRGRVIGKRWVRRGEVVHCDPAVGFMFGKSDEPSKMEQLTLFRHDFFTRELELHVHPNGMNVLLFIGTVKCRLDISSGILHGEIKDIRPTGENAIPCQPKSISLIDPGSYFSLAFLRPSMRWNASAGRHNFELQLPYC
jgi:hypothetical protein